MRTMNDFWASLLGTAIPYVTLALWLSGAWWFWYLCDRSDHPLGVRILLGFVALIISGLVCAGIALALLFAACRGMKI